jgi:RND family efflux transporter MFP subunit
MRFQTAFLLSALLPALAGCSRAGAEKAALPVAEPAAAAAGVRLVRPTPTLEAAGLRVTGQLRAKNEATLSAPATGQVVKIHADVGDRVKRGAPLLGIDDSNVRIGVDQARAARDMAEAAYASAARELERTKQLRAQDGAPAAALERMQSSHDQARAALEQARAALRMAEETLRDHVLRAPFDGVVTARHVQLGETVATMPPTPMITVVDPEHLEVRLPVPEAQAAAAKVGAKLAGTVNPSGRPFAATIRTVGAVVDLRSRTVEVIADVAGAGPELRPGSLVEVSLVPEVGQGVYVPALSVQERDGRHFVWVADGNRAVRREVEAAPVSAGYFHVREGLAETDRVVGDGASGLSEGAALRILE